MSTGRGEYEVYRVEDSEMVRLKYRRRVPWDKIISLILEGHDIFIPCDRRMAYYIRRNLERRIGELVEVYPSVYSSMDGYIFKMSLVHKMLARFSGEGSELEK